jgi:hypothetical protein
MPVLLTLQSSLQKVPLSVKPKFADSLPNPPAEAPSERAAELRNTLVGVRAQGCLRARARVQVHCDRTEAFRTVQRKPRRPFLGHHLRASKVIVATPAAEVFVSSQPTFLEIFFN